METLFAGVTNDSNYASKDRKWQVPIKATDDLTEATYFAV